MRKEREDVVIKTCVDGDTITPTIFTWSNVYGVVISIDCAGRMRGFHHPSTWNLMAFASDYPVEGDGYVTITFECDGADLATVESFSSIAENLDLALDVGAE